MYIVNDRERGRYRDIYIDTQKERWTDNIEDVVYRNRWK